MVTLGNRRNGYGGSATKGLNSDIIRFLRNDMRDVQVLNWVGHGGAADNPLLGGYKLEGFEGWGGDQDFNNYLYLTFAENLPTKFLQHYQVIDSGELRRRRVTGRKPGKTDHTEKW